MQNIIRFLLHTAMIGFLTILTQVGGIIWAIIFLLFSFGNWKKKFSYRVFIFLFFYCFSSLLVVPSIASHFGRKPLPWGKSAALIPHNYLTPFLNRHYVRKGLASELKEISVQFSKEFEGSKISYLDASFPFIDGFPLFPHLSHNDGRKVDLSFMYLLDGKATNLKPSRFGYGYFEEPQKYEINKPEMCKKRNSAYDYSKYFTLGSRDDLELDEERTRAIVELIMDRQKTQKIFIEPHLKERLHLHHDKIRFQGCHSVRHDDHIHYQIK